MQDDKRDYGVVYGFPASLYTAKLRSYLIKKAIPFLERHPGHRRFREHIVPTCGSSRMPIYEFPDGSIVQDTNDIIARLERDYPDLPALPDSPVQKMVVRLLNLFADEALLKQAMHYRWNTTQDNREFITYDFGLAFGREASEKEIRERGQKAARRFSSDLPLLGVHPETACAIEEVHLEFLNLLERHVAVHPYLLGGHPSLADYALMGPLYAHLTRDPHAGQLLYAKAPRVLRWTEEMNRPGRLSPDHPERSLAFGPGDEVPATLEPILSLMFETFGPELSAFIDRFCSFVSDNPDLPSGSSLEPSGYDQPSLGEVNVEYRGTKMRMAARMFPVWLFQLAQLEYLGLNRKEKEKADDLLERTGGDKLMAFQIPRMLERNNNKLVLGDFVSNSTRNTDTR